MIHPIYRACAVLTGALLGLAITETALGQARLGQPVGEEPTPAKQPSLPRKLPLPLAQPEPEQIFRLESEDQLRERMVKEYRDLGQKKVLFPPDAQVRFQDKHVVFPPATTVLEPTGLCSHPLYFEQPLSERYGIYCPLAQPLISTSRFYLDTLCLPVQMILNPPWSLTCPDGTPPP